MVADINISELLVPSKSLTIEHKNQLNELKDKYPWSEIVQVLYLKSLKDTKDIRFSEELKRVALISHDRAKLFHFLYSSDIQKTIDKVEEEMAALPEVDGLVEPNWKKESHPTSVSDSDEVIPAEVPELKLVPEIGLKPISELEEDLSKEQNQDNGPESLLSQQTTEKDAHISDEISTSLSDAPTNNSSKNEEDSQTDDSIKEPISDIKQKELEEPSSSQGHLNQLIISEAVDTVMIKEVMDDINEKRSNTELTSPKAPVTSTRTSENVSSDDFINWLVNNARSVNYPSFDKSAEQPKPKSIEHIIDKFIESEPQIKRGKAKEYEKGNLAPDSLVDREEFVTETLAEIYVSQGNISKAKRAFQLLSLKYPEKSIYFAARIKRLGQKKPKK